MAAIGCSTATTQVGQLCTARYNTRVAEFQAMAVSDRSQSCSVAQMRSRAAMPGQGLHRAHQYSAWGRGNNTIISGGMPNLGSQPRGWWGNFLQIFRPSANASSNFGNNFGENVRVDPEYFEPEVKPAEAEGRTLNLVEAKKTGQDAHVAAKAVDKSSAVATSALDMLKTTGLEINLDVGLKELTIKELVLKDLGLVLEVKTKPQPQAQAEAETPAQAKKDGGAGNNTA